MGTLFSLNVNKIALLRNSRDTNYPKVEHFVQQALDCGVKGITVHPRPDERHIRFSDLPIIKSLTDQVSGCEFNIEGYPSDHFIEHVNSVQPHQVTLVPDAVDQLTSDHGWDLSQSLGTLTDVMKKIDTDNIRVSVFWDPIVEGLEDIQAIGVDAIELYTEPYVRAYENNDPKALESYLAAFEKARAMGFRINAGHDFNLSNLGNFLQKVPVDEVSIGHAVWVESIQAGFQGVVQQYLGLCD